MIIEQRDNDGKTNLVGDPPPQDTAPPAYDANDPIAGPSTLRAPETPPSPPLDRGPPTGADPNSERSIENVKARIRANPFITPPTNFVSITEGNNAVKGSWTIDTSLSPPASLLAPLSPGEVRPNLKLDCHNGSIHANVRFVQGDVQPRALVCASTYNGSVRVAVMSRGKQRVSIKCQSHNGAIKVLLPRDFTGLVGYRTHNGSTLFSPAVKGCTTTFSLTRGVGKCFIGDWQHAEFSPQSTAASVTAQHPTDPPRQLSPTDTADTPSCPSSPGSRDPRSHMRRTSATSTHYEAPLPDPQVRVWSPDSSSYGDYEYAASSVGSSSGAASATPYANSSVVSSSTVLPSHSASQVGVGQNLSPTPFYTNVPSGIGAFNPNTTSPNRVPTPSTVSSLTYAQSSPTSLLDDASLSWQGDLLEVDTVNGTIRISFVDEPRESKTGGIAQGAARLVKGWLAEKGVSADRFVGLTREASGWMKGV